MSITSKAKSFIGDNVILKVKVVIGSGGRWLEPIESQYATTKQMATHIGSAKVLRSYCPARLVDVTLNYDSFFQRGQIWEFSLGDPEYHGYFILRSRQITKSFGSGTEMMLRFEKKDLPYEDAVAPLLRRGMIAAL